MDEVGKQGQTVPGAFLGVALDGKDIILSHRAGKGDSIGSLPGNECCVGRNDVITMHKVEAREIVDALGDEIPIQLGGGIRDLDTIERILDNGVSYVIIGTAAVKNPGFLHDACSAFPGQIIVGLDAKDGKVAVDGWSKLTGHDVIDLAKKCEDYGVEGIIYTDIGRDGMLSGINIEATVKLAQALRVPVIASGGLSSLDDIRALCAVEFEGISATIAGRAIYDGSLDFAAAQAEADRATQR